MDKSRVNNVLFEIVMIIMISIVFMSGVSALGITPGRTTINFDEKNEKIVIPFSVLNNEHRKMNVIFLVQGELNESITLFANNVEFLPSEEAKSFNYELKLKAKKLTPGLHTGEIIALEIPQANEEGTYVGATVGVATQIYLYVPYPGKYVDAELLIFDAEQNTTATFVVPVINRGKVGIGEVRAIIDIYTTLNERIVSIETDYTSLDPGARTELSAKWPVDVNSGDYLAKVTVFYDGESRTLEKVFAIGKNVLSIESILVNDFRLGEIAKLQILVENRWNQELQNVFANLIVYNNDNEAMADVKSATENIPSLTRKELIAYWDTVGVQEGEYDGKLIVKYNEKSSDKNLLLKISADSLDITGVGYAIRGDRKSGGITLTTVLLVLVIILLIVNLAWFVFFRRFMKKKR